MLRRSTRFLEHYQYASEGGNIVYDNSRRKKSLFHVQWKRFRRSSPFTRFGIVLAGVSGLGLAYLGLCVLVYYRHQPKLESLYYPELHSVERIVIDSKTDSHRKIYSIAGHEAVHNTNLTWDQVEPTLRPGDILLLRGADPESSWITFVQLVKDFLQSSTMRYSHVAVVVEPAVLKQRGPESSKSGHQRWWKWWGRRPSTEQLLREEEERVYQPPEMVRGVVILEAAVNNARVPDVTGKVRQGQVQRVFARERLTSTFVDSHGEEKPAVLYCGVCRMPRDEVGFLQSGNPSYEAVAETFSSDYQDRPLSSDRGWRLLLPSALKWYGEKTEDDGSEREVTNTEVVLRLLQRMNMVKRHWVWVPLKAGEEISEETLSQYDTFLADRLHSPLPSLFMKPTVADRLDVSRGRCDLHLSDGRHPFCYPLVHLPYQCINSLEGMEGVIEIENSDVLLDRSESLHRGCMVEQEDNETRQIRSLSAGHLARGKDGALYQLQFYYKEDVRRMAPYHFVKKYPPWTECDVGEELTLGVPGREKWVEEE